jgi:hypothetical protein
MPNDESNVGLIRRLVVGSSVYSGGNSGGSPASSLIGSTLRKPTNLSRLQVSNRFILFESCKYETKRETISQTH